MAYAIRVVKAHDLWYVTRVISMGRSHETRCDLSTDIDARPNHLQPRARAAPGGRTGQLAGGEGLQGSRHRRQCNAEPAPHVPRLRKKAGRGVRTRPGFPVGLEETVCGQPDLQWGFQAACRILRHTCSDVSGMSRSTMPRGVSASSAALITAAGAPMAPASPQPLAPSGLWVQGWLSSHSVTNAGRSSARASA